MKVTSPIGQFQTSINPENWEGYMAKAPSPAEGKGWDERLGSFHKLILIRSFMEEKVSLSKICGKGFQRFGDLFSGLQVESFNSIFFPISG